MMKIAFDVTDLVAARRRGRRGPNGVERVTLGLLRAAHSSGRSHLLHPVYLDGDGVPRGVAPESFKELLRGSPSTSAAEPFSVALPEDSGFDVLVSTGASWTRGRLQALHTRLSDARRSIRLVAIVHDLIPFTFPKFVSEGFEAEYRRWAEYVTAHAATLIVPSEASRHDMVRFFPDAESKLHVMPLGADLAAHPQHGTRKPTAEAPILYVSSVVPRKNHETLVRAWRRAFATMARKDVPPLVIAGSCRWRSALRLKYLAGPLHGRLRIVGNIPDHELEHVLDAALFTVFPSHAEGWGLPVSEALARGKTGLVSTAIPAEVDMELLTRIAPDDEASWAHEMHRLATSPALRKTQEDRIRRLFHPRSWQDALNAVLAACE